MMDARYRKITIPMSHAIIDAEGGWLYLATSLGGLLHEYAADHRPHPMLDGFALDDPKTWSDVASHVWRQNYQIRAMQKPPTFTLHATDITTDIAADARFGGPQYAGIAAIRDDEINDKPRGCGVHFIKSTLAAGVEVVAEGEL